MADTILTERGFRQGSAVAAHSAIRRCAHLSLNLMRFESERWRWSIDVCVVFNAHARCFVFFDKCVCVCLWVSVCRIMSRLTAILMRDLHTRCVYKYKYNRNPFTENGLICEISCNQIPQHWLKLTSILNLMFVCRRCSLNRITMQMWRCSRVIGTLDRSTSSSWWFAPESAATQLNGESISFVVSWIARIGSSNFVDRR